MKAPTVKTFDEDEIHRLIDEADPTLREYINALKRALENQGQLTALCIKKRREESRRTLEPLVREAMDMIRTDMSWSEVDYVRTMLRSALKEVEG